MSDPSALTAAQHAARARRQAGDPAGAAALLDDALEHLRPAYGEDHPQVLSAAHELARLHREVGQPAHARRVLEEALAAGQRRFGDADPLLLAISYDLATVAEELGNRHEARRNFGRVATAGPAVLGDDHWAVRAARDYLGGQDRSAMPHRAPPQPAPSPTPQRAPGPTPQPAPGPTPISPSPPTATMATPPRQAPASAQPPAHPVGAPPTWPATGPAAVSPPRQHPVPPSQRARRGRGAVVAACVAAVAAVAAAVLAGIAVFGDDGARTARITAPATTPPVWVGGRPPGDVRVTRDGDALVLTWTDPAPGRVSFVITGGQAGEELRFVGQVPSGAAPRFPVHGFNPTLDYCFQVAAVYSTTELGVAQPVCTRGAARTPAR